jgi:L-lysine 2,3-aminomutase
MSQTQPIPPGRKQTGVPRRFGMGVLLVITTMYAVLFACLHCFRRLRPSSRSASAAFPRRNCWAWSTLPS